MPCDAEGRSQRIERSTLHFSWILDSPTSKVDGEANTVLWLEPHGLGVCADSAVSYHTSNLRVELH